MSERDFQFLYYNQTKSLHNLLDLTDDLVTSGSDQSQLETLMGQYSQDLDSMETQMCNMMDDSSRIEEKGVQLAEEDGEWYPSEESISKTIYLNTLKSNLEKHLLRAETFQEVDQELLQELEDEIKDLKHRIGSSNSKFRTSKRNRLLQVQLL